MGYHRILNVPASQIEVGDVILLYKGSASGKHKVFVGGYGTPERVTVTEKYLDHSDGEIYIKSDEDSQYCQPYEQIQLDCLLTFGKNNGGIK